MKKTTYIKPVIQVVRIQTAQMLTNSGRAVQGITNDEGFIFDDVDGDDLR